MGRFAMIVCPLCSRSRKLVATRWEDPEASSRWDFWDEDSPVIQIREGGGKKSSNELTEEERRLLAKPQPFEEALKDPQYRPYILKMFDQIEKIYRIIQKYR